MNMKETYGTPEEFNNKLNSEQNDEECDATRDDKN